MIEFIAWVAAGVFLFFFVLLLSQAIYKVVEYLFDFLLD